MKAQVRFFNNKRWILAGIAFIGTLFSSGAYAGTVTDVVTLNSSECFSGCGTTTFESDSEPTSPTVLGNVLFTFVNDFDVYLTDPNTGNVLDHVFADEGLGNHDAIYFSNTFVTSDASIGGACPNPSECVAADGTVQDLSALILGQDPNAGLGDLSLTVQSFESSSAPEPATFAMLLAGAGLACAGALRRKRSRE